VVHGAWGRLAGRAGGAALISAATQVGVAVGLGLTRWTDFATALTWVVFIFACSALAGVAAVWRSLARAGVVRRASAVLAAALGAAVAVPLVWLPVRSLIAVPVADEILTGADAGRAVAIAAAAGVLIGAVLAAAALAGTAVAASVAAWVGWTWLAGTTSALVAAAAGTPGSPRLGFLEVPALPAVVGPVPTLLATAVVLGFAVAVPARRVGLRPVGVVAAGFAGPAVIAAPYLVAVGGGRTTLVAVAAVGTGSLVAAAVSLRRTGTAAGVALAVPTADATPAQVTPVVAPVQPAPVRTARVPAAASAASTAATTAGLTPSTGAATSPGAGSSGEASSGGGLSGAAGSVGDGMPDASVSAGAPATSGGSTGSAATGHESDRGRRSGKGRKAGGDRKSGSERRSGDGRKSGGDRKSANDRQSAPGRGSAGGRRSAAGRKPATSGEAAPAQGATAAASAVHSGSGGRDSGGLTGAAERLRRDEQEHVTWMQNLLNTPPDPQLVTRRDR
jgi:hypothetical protein